MTSMQPDGFHLLAALLGPHHPFGDLEPVLHGVSG
jgi:hypothetical protein